jgi:hypothetical protein
MRDNAFRIHRGEWGKSQQSVSKFSNLSNNNEGKIKTRLGFIYFIVLVCSLVVFLIR